MKEIDRPQVLYVLGPYPVACIHDGVQERTLKL